MTAHDHHGSGASAEAAGAASWMIAMVLMVVLAVALIVALFVWMPWDNDSGGTAPGTNDNAPAQEGESADIDIQGDIDVTDGD
jgi:flagellar basal body-associated protein FliL